MEKVDTYLMIVPLTRLDDFILLTYPFQKNISYQLGNDCLILKHFN